MIKPFQLLSALVVTFGMVAIEPELSGLIFVFGYALSGPFEWILGWKKAHDEDDIFQPLDEDDSVMDPRDNSDEHDENWNADVREIKEGKKPNG